MREVTAIFALLMSPSCGSDATLEASEKDLLTAASLQQLEGQLAAETGDALTAKGEAVAPEGSNEGWGSLGAKDH